MTSGLKADIPRHCTPSKHHQVLDACKSHPLLTSFTDSYHYPVSFLERQRFLQILYDTLESKNHIHTGKKVLAVESGIDCAVVKTSDGSEYRADLVVGADGVHSVVRSEIWRHLKQTCPRRPTEKENSGIKHSQAVKITHG